MNRSRRARTGAGAIRTKRTSNSRHLDASLARPPARRMRVLTGRHEPRGHRSSLGRSACDGEQARARRSALGGHARPRRGPRRRARTDLAVRTWGPLRRMQHGSAMSEPDDLSSPRGQRGSDGPHRRGAPSRPHWRPQDRPDCAVTPAGVHQRFLGEPRITDKDWVRREALESFAGYPLGFRSEVFGVLAMFARGFLEAEFERLRVFAAQASIAIKNARLFDEVLQLSRRLEAENFYLKGELRADLPAGIVGESAAIRRVLADLERVARTSSTVLLLGETGTGKELLANALHELSPRRGRAFVKVSCAAISPASLRVELFGHEKGAFTGALQRRAGRFELAHGGTLFLDEIGEFPHRTTGQAASRAPGEGAGARGRHQADPGRRPGHLRDESKPRGGGRREALSRISSID